MHPFVGCREKRGLDDLSLLFIFVHRSFAANLSGAEKGERKSGLISMGCQARAIIYMRKLDHIFPQELLKASMSKGLLGLLSDSTVQCLFSTYVGDSEVWKPGSPVHESPNKTQLSMEVLSTW